MSTGQILLAIITGLAVNECCDVSPWVDPQARPLVSPPPVRPAGPR